MLAAIAPTPSAPVLVPELAGAAAGEVAEALTRLPESIIGRVAYQVLGGLAGPSRLSALELARGAPFGVGYFVGLWTPAPE